MARRIVIYGMMVGGKNNPRHGQYTEVEISGTVDDDISYDDIIKRFEKKGYRFTRSFEQKENGGDRITIGQDRPNYTKDVESKDDFLKRLDREIRDKTSDLKQPSKEHKGKGVKKESDYKREWENEDDRKGEIVNDFFKL